MKFGDRTLRINTKGKDVEELQLRLAGFAGTVWDGDFGKGTKKQVIAFQRDFMKINNPDGIVGNDTYAALDDFAKQFPIDFDKIRCPSQAGMDSEFCTCKGFGQQRFKKTYLKSRRPMQLHWSRSGKDELTESVHQYEYPGIHKAVLHTYRAFLFYATDPMYKDPRITSGYRCHLNNVNKSRTSTNHMGKALDFAFNISSRQKRREVCNAARTLLVEKSNCQIRWNRKNRKALEPGYPAQNREFIAETWIHLDVRQYEPDKYLLDRFFITDAEGLDNKELVS